MEEKWEVGMEKQNSNETQIGKRPSEMNLLPDWMKKKMDEFQENCMNFMRLMDGSNELGCQIQETLTDTKAIDERLLEFAGSSYMFYM